MVYKKYSYIIFCLFFSLCSYGVGSSSDLSELFLARNRAANVYAWAKENSRDKLRALFSFGCALGVYKYLLATRKAGKLVAFMEASTLGTTVYQLLGVLRKFTVDPLVRWFPWVAKRRKVKNEHTRALFAFLQSHNIKTVDQLPPDEKVRGKPAEKMLEKLQAKINYAGLDADTGWVGEFMVKERPDYVGSIPEEIDRCINFINNPGAFQRHTAALPKGVLLIGKPGVGKTTLAKLIAYRAQCPFIEESPSAFANKYVGTGPNELKNVFDKAERAAIAAHRKLQQEREQEEARRLGFWRVLWRGIKRKIFGYQEPQEDGYIRPTILCLNELDSITRQRSMCTNDNQEHEHTLTQMFNELDRSKHVFLVGTSNRDGDFFDRAAIRDGRLGEPVTIPLPEAPDRFEIIKSYMQKVPTLVPLLRVPGFVKFKLLEPLEHLEHHGVRYAFWRSMVDRTEGFSGDGLRAIFNNAAMQAGAENAQYLGMGHLEGALATMLAKHTANMAQRPDQNRPRAAGLQEAQRAVPTRVASPARGSGQDAAVMDEEVPDI